MSETALPVPRERPELRPLALAGIVSLTLAVSVAHYLTPPTHPLLHNIFQRLYYLPLLLACASYGVRGGLLTAGAIAVLYVPHIVFHWMHDPVYQANQALEIALLALVGLVGGILSDRERSLRREAEAVAAERDRALEDLRETVETLRKADRLATLGTLAAGMAHEIRNPLGAMGGALEILEADRPVDHPHREFVEILRQEVDRLGRVAGKYLDFARPQVPDSRPVDVNATVRSATELLERSAARAGVTVRSRLHADLRPAMADPVQLRQALVNLLLNGIQSMPSGGELEITTRAGKDRVEIEVRDHGEGLPEVPVDRLFEPFFSTRPGGTGLGLAVSRQIAVAHDGRLTAEAAEGGGARFRLELPEPSTGEAS
jgi:signal transduction histidine kinase